MMWLNQVSVKTGPSQLTLSDRVRNTIDFLVSLIKDVVVAVVDNIRLTLVDTFLFLLENFNTIWSECSLVLYINFVVLITILTGISVVVTVFLFKTLIGGLIMGLLMSTAIAYVAKYAAEFCRSGKPK